MKFELAMMFRNEKTIYEANCMGLLDPDRVHHELGAGNRFTRPLDR